MSATPAITRPALRYHGGKFRLAPWVILGERDFMASDVRVAMGGAAS